MLTMLRLNYRYHISYNPSLTLEIPEEFPKIYRQSLKAKLNQIYGMDLRKALDFFVNDFAVHLRPEQKENITSNQLGYVIKTYFDEFPNIVKLFKAASQKELDIKNVLEHDIC